jgi:hypothetical protein
MASPVLRPRAEETSLYRPPPDPVLVAVPLMEFLVVEGQGGPDGWGRYQTALTALFEVSGSVMVALRRMGRPDLRMRPLEGLWWSEGAPRRGRAATARERDRWTLMVRQPDAVPEGLYEIARIRAAARLGDDVVDRVRVEPRNEGLCVQLTHLGPYGTEDADIDRLHRFAADADLRPRGRFHEIYLSDPRVTPPSRIRTVLRVPVWRV